MNRSSDSGALSYPHDERPDSDMESTEHRLTGSETVPYLEAVDTERRPVRKEKERAKIPTPSSSPLRDFLDTQTPLARMEGNWLDLPEPVLRDTSPSSDGSDFYDVLIPEPPTFRYAGIRRFFGGFLFWTPARSVVQISVFGPKLQPGTTSKLTIYAHPPESIKAVSTLARAFKQQQICLLATGYIPRMVKTGEEFGFRLGIANAGLAKVDKGATWTGASKAWNCEIFVPWESPAGRFGGMLQVAIGLDEVIEIPFEAIIAEK